MEFKNQYIVTEGCAVGKASRSTKWNGLSVYLGVDTDFHMNESCMIIGKVLHSDYPNKPVTEIASDLGERLSNNEFIDYADSLVGRYVIFIKNQKDILVLTDACSLKRGLYFKYNGFKSITSSEKFAEYILGLEIKLSAKINNLLQDPNYKKAESPWYGLKSYDSRFKFILPNHILSWKGFSLERLPIPSMTKLDPIEESARMLKNTISALASKYKLVQPLTAGVDSRVLLAASSSKKNEIKYYVFTHNGDQHEDVRIAQQLSDINNNELEVINPLLNFKDSDFDKILFSTVLNARDLPKTNNIRYHFENTPRSCVNVNGNGAEIFRCFYGTSKFKVTPSVLSVLGGGSKWPILHDLISEWYYATNVRAYASKANISVLDLFYWEQRMAIWGSMYPLEQDVAIDEISPFNNRKLLFNMLRIKLEDRIGPEFKSSKKIISTFNNALNEVPFNPDSSSVINSKLSFKSIILRLLNKDTVVKVNVLKAVSKAKNTVF